MPEFNPYAAPESDTGERPAAPDGDGSGLWRSGRLLVMEKTASLPDVCVVCNAPAGGRILRRVMYWHSAWWYLTLLVNVVVYVITAVIVRRKADIRVGLCREHVARRRTWITIAWSMVAAAVGLLLLATSIDDSFVPMLAAVPVLLVTAALIGIYGARVVRPKRITADHAWIAGVSPELLATLPDWGRGGP